MRQLPLALVQPNELFKESNDHGIAPTNSLLPVAGRRLEQGASHSDTLYRWDNEYGHLETHVADFRASKYLVSNAEFKAFVDAGGYENQDYWNEEGWGWRMHSQATHPTFWVREGDSFRYRTITREIDMPWNWPVDVNALEAAAFCRWASQSQGRDIRLQQKPNGNAYVRKFQPTSQTGKPHREISILNTAPPLAQSTVSRHSALTVSSFSILSATFGNGRRHQLTAFPALKSTRFMTISQRRLSTASTTSSKGAAISQLETAHSKIHAMPSDDTSSSMLDSAMSKARSPLFLLTIHTKPTSRSRNISNSTLVPTITACPISPVHVAS
jgi:hypothetical protein